MSTLLGAVAVEFRENWASRRSGSYVSLCMATAKVNGDRNNDAISKNQPRENVRNRHDNVTGAKLNVKNRDAVKRNATEERE